MHLIPWSRGQAEADWRCPRFRYYAYEYQGGLVADNLSLDLFLGTCVHDAVAGLLRGAVSPATIAADVAAGVTATLSRYWRVPEPAAGASLSDAQRQVREKATWVESVVHGLARVLVPSLRGQVVGVEVPCIFPHDQTGQENTAGPFVFRCRPDVVLDTPDGLVYLEIKTSSTKRAEWITSWQTAIQIHATMRALAFTFRRPVAHAVVQGIYKGSEAFGRLTSPLVYGYLTRGTPPFARPSYAYEWRPGLTRTPVWDIPGGAAGWMANMPVAQLSEQFPQTPPIAYQPAMTEAFFRQRAIREQAVRALPAALREEDPAACPDADTLLDTHYPQTFSACRPAWGDPCPYFAICHGGVSDPLAQGFRHRDTDHQAGFLDLIDALGGTP